jgi:hypothetical protein
MKPAQARFPTAFAGPATYVATGDLKLAVNAAFKLQRLGKAIDGAVIKCQQPKTSSIDMLPITNSFLLVMPRCRPMKYFLLEAR